MKIEAEDVRTWVRKEGRDTPSQLGVLLAVVAMLLNKDHEHHRDYYRKKIEDAAAKEERADER